jgi:hypothetical protein
LRTAIPRSNQSSLCKMISSDMGISLAIFAVSVALRISYLVLSVPNGSPTGGHVDIWGDGVHMWLLSYLTAKNNFLYTDLRPNGLQLIWLPLHPMITAFTMKLTGIYSLEVIRTLSLFYGSMTAVVVYHTAKLIFNEKKHIALAAGLGLAFNAWWIATNSEGVVESLLALVLSLLVYYWIKGNRVAAAFFTLVAGFVKYEGWVITFMLILGDLVIHRSSKKTKAALIIAWVIPILVWSGWSYYLTGDPIAWYINQKQFLDWDIAIIGKPSDLMAIFYYPRLMLVMTGGLFAVSCFLAVKRSGHVRVLVAIALAYLIIRSIAYTLGQSLPLERYIVILIPLTYLLAVWPFPATRQTRRHRIAYAGALLIIMVLPFVTEITRFQNMSYIYNPEMRAGIWLQNHYEDGVVVSDLPTTIGYAYPDPSPERFLSAAVVYDEFTKHGSSLTWLYEYFSKQQVTYFVLYNVPYSASGHLENVPRSMLRINEGSDSYYFKLVYSDTAQNPKYWEHQYGIPDLFIYTVDYSDYWLQPGSLPS